MTCQLLAAGTGGNGHALGWGARDIESKGLPPHQFSTDTLRKNKSNLLSMRFAVQVCTMHHCTGVYRQNIAVS